jgi:hypothetical protein
MPPSFQLCRRRLREPSRFHFFTFCFSTSSLFHWNQSLHPERYADDQISDATEAAKARGERIGIAQTRRR